MVEFEFNGKKASEYGVIVTKIDNNDDLESRSLILGSKNKYRARENHFGAQYDGNYVFDVTFVKDPCKKDYLPWLENSIENGKTYSTLVYPESPSIKYDSDSKLNILTYPSSFDVSITNGTLISEHSDYFNSNDISTLNGWLTSPQYPKLIKITSDDDDDEFFFSDDIEFFGTVTAVKTEKNDRPYQITYTVTCDSPYGYSPEKTTDKISSTNETPTAFHLYNNSDCINEYVYPILKITPYGNYDGEMILKNSSDDNKTLKLNFKNYPYGNDTICMDCKNLKLYRENNGEVTFGDLGITENNISDIYWLRLAYGRNEITISGDILVQIIYREPRKTGAYL